MKNENKIDKRILKSKKAIKIALMEILSAKSISKITVKEICEKADVNRKTFYNYYEGVYDVLSEIENDTMKVFSENIEKVDINEIINKPELLFNFLVDIANTDIEFYSNMFKMENSSSLLDKLMRFIFEVTVESVKPLLNVPDAQLHTICKFVISGVITVFRDWFRGDMEQSLDEISKTLSYVCFTGVTSLNRLPSDK